MRVVHVPAGGDGDGEPRVLATDVERPTSTLSNAKGLRFRRDLPEDYAFVMDVARPAGVPVLGGPRWAVVDMLFVHVPLDVLWLVEGEVAAKKLLRPWTGMAAERADTIVELPAGAAADVTVGDTVRIESEGSPAGDTGPTAGGEGSG